MTLLYIDTTTANDFDTIVQFLRRNNIDIVERDKVRLFVKAELTHNQLMELRELPLEEFISYGTEPLLATNR